MRAVLLIAALTVVPSLASAQQPCTSDARHVVDEIYRHILERAPDPASAGWVDRLASGSMTVREVVRDVARSPEHLQRFGNESRDQVVATLYRHILGRQPDPEGLQVYINVAARRGYAAVVDQLVNSPEYRRSFGDWGVPGSGGVTFCRPGALGSANRNRSLGMRFRQMDTNHDGVISRNEWRGNPRSFQMYDWNRDGVLSGDEVRVDVRRSDAVEARNEDRFYYLDVNGNGFIDRNEWDGGRDAFIRLDTSRDGRLTRAEFDTTSAGRFSTFVSLDVNRDGTITLSEWPWSHRSFDQQDLNGDGVITRGEFRSTAP